MTTLEREMIGVWGREDQYFKELDKFYDAHRNCSRLVFDEKLHCPIKAEYDFIPRQVYVEKLQLDEELSRLVNLK